MNLLGILILGFFAILVMAIAFCAYEARQEALKDLDQ